MNNKARHSNFPSVAANRRAFSKPNAEGLPHFFSMVTETTAGMALPISADQIGKIAQKYNVGVVISCIEEENCPYEQFFDTHNVKHLLLTWKDRSIIDLKKLKDVLEQVRSIIESENKVAVFHCFAGKGRTGTSLAAYEILTKQMKPSDAISFIREKRPGSIETIHQEEILFNFYNQIYPSDPQSFVPTEHTFQNMRTKLRSLHSHSHNNNDDDANADVGDDATNHNQ